MTMGKYIINGGRTLNGSLNIKGAKNSVLPLLAASILTDEDVILENCPNIADVNTMIKIMQQLGCVVKFENNVITINSKNLCNGEIKEELAKELRSSIFLLGALLSRLEKAKVAHPGGCDIGKRPINIHLNGLKQLGIEIDEQEKYIFCDSSQKHCANIQLNIPSVGATENLIMASVLTKGETTLKNCAKEPEIEDLQNMLNAMGAKISGAGTDTIKIVGVKKLHGIVYTPIPDRIVAGTYIIATAMTGGSVTLNNVNEQHIWALLSKLTKTTCNISIKNGIINVQSSGKLASLQNIETMYYPGFPTDLQTQILALQCISNGSCVIQENIFETRFKPVSQLIKMGADIVVKDNIAYVRGVPFLTGAEVVATDLRGGASLVLAGLVAKGETIVNDVFHIERGYEDMALDLSSLGADIYKVE